jgi:hypothetical protein
MSRRPAFTLIGLIFILGVLLFLLGIFSFTLRRVTVERERAILEERRAEEQRRQAEEERRRLEELKRKELKKANTSYHTLMHGTIDHGMNFRKPGVTGPFTLEDYLARDKEDGAKGQKDFSRLATTYYHRFGPAGVIMERWNWASTVMQKTASGEMVAAGNTYWAWKQNQWHADARMPGSLIGLALAEGNTGASLPGGGALMHTFSEPPIATVGLGTGTMASY